MSDSPRETTPSGQRSQHAQARVAGPQERDSGAAHSTLERWFKLVSGIVAPTTVLTALLFYYGYVATTAEYGYFGVSMGSLGLSTQDFLLRSAGALYVPLGVILLALVTGLWSHAYVRDRLSSSAARRGWRRLAVILVACGAVVFARGLAGVVFPDVARNEAIAMTPVCLGVGIGSMAYGRYLLGALATSRTDVGRHWSQPAAFAAVVGLIVLSLFWAANSFAAAYGTGRAQQVAARIGERPVVVLDTTERIYADYAGIDELELPDSPDQRFRYRYLGLRLLIESGGRLFLLPEGWTVTEGAVLVVTADSSTRLQFYRDAS